MATPLTVSLVMGQKHSSQPSMCHSAAWAPQSLPHTCGSGSLSRYKKGLPWAGRHHSALPNRAAEPRSGISSVWGVTALSGSNNDTYQAVWSQAAVSPVEQCSGNVMWFSTSIYERPPKNTWDKEGEVLVGGSGLTFVVSGKSPRSFWYIICYPIFKSQCSPAHRAIASRKWECKTH